MRSYSAVALMSLPCTTKGIHKVLESLLKQSGYITVCPWIYIDRYIFFSFLPRSKTAVEFDATACGFLLLQFYRQLGLMSVSIASREKMGNNAGGLSPLFPG